MYSDLKTSLHRTPPIPPPRINPKYSPALKGCCSCFIGQMVNHYIYLWTTYGNSFWAYPVEVAGEKLYCYTWDGKLWSYIQIDLSLIDSFF